jgi:hypothetical protein
MGIKGRDVQQQEICKAISALGRLTKRHPSSSGSDHQTTSIAATAGRDEGVFARPAVIADIFTPLHTI